MKHGLPCWCITGGVRFSAPSLPQGPHIASVTLAAYECGSTDFPEPPYPDQIVCSQDGVMEESISLFSIMSKVRLEACMWVSKSRITVGHHASSENVNDLCSKLKDRIVCFIF